MQQYLDLLIDALLDEGFTVEEASRLIQLREEYEERLATEETKSSPFHSLACRTWAHQRLLLVCGTPNDKWGYRRRTGT